MINPAQIKRVFDLINNKCESINHDTNKNEINKFIQAKDPTLFDKIQSSELKKGLGMLMPIMFPMVNNAASKEVQDNLNNTQFQVIDEVKTEKTEDSARSFQCFVKEDQEKSSGHSK